MLVCAGCKTRRGMIMIKDYIFVIPSLTGVFHGFYRGGTGLLHGYNMGVKLLLQGCFRGVSGVLHVFYMSVTGCYSLIYHYFRGTFQLFFGTCFCIILHKFYHLCIMSGVMSHFPMHLQF